MHRSFANQLSDCQFIAETVRRLSAGTKRRSPTKHARSSDKVGVAARVLLEESGGETTYFALYKLLFMAEVRHLGATSQRLTEGYFGCQKDGPYCVEPHASRLAALIPGCRTKSIGNQLVVSLGQQQGLLDETPGPVSLLNAEARRALVEVAKKYGRLPASKLKTVTYLAAPMRELLRREGPARQSVQHCCAASPVGEAGGTSRRP